MSFPNIPNVTPTISINREEVIDLLLASVAFEELGLAHIINAEAEKIQAVVGTLPGEQIPIVGIADLIAINNSVDNTLKTVIKNEILLQFKLENIIDQLTCSISLIARRIDSQFPGGSIQTFFGTVGGTNPVTVTILVNGSPVSSTTASVVGNQFTATLSVPQGLPPGSIVTVRVQSGSCEIEELVETVPIIPTP